MGKSLRFKVIIFCLVYMFMVFAWGCSKEEKGQDGASPNNTQNNKQLEIVYGDWATEIASTNVVKAVLQEKLGYDVEITSLSVPAMYQGIATGDVDGMVAAWLPTTQEPYLKEFEDQLENLGPNLKGTKIGLVVPKYVNIDQTDELEENAEKFDGKIIGIEPGAGMMLKTEKLIEDYGLKSYELVSGSGATMVAALADAIDKNEWIVITGWSPHWMFSKWDLKYLEEPKKVYGEEEQINTLVRKGLEKDMPVAYKFLDNFNWEPSDMEELMVWNQEKGADPYENAKRWIEENEDKVNAWLK